MKKKLGAVLLVIALVLTLGLASFAYAAPPVPQLLDSVNIGDTTSEAGHNLIGWSDIWTCGLYSVPNKTGDWCACHDGGVGVGNMRLIWGDGGETCDLANNWASVDLNAGALYAKTLKVDHLDGSANDGFNVYVNETYVGTYVDQFPSNTWTATEFDISSWNFNGLLTIKFVATAPAWGGCGTYGQVAFNMIELYGPYPVTIDIKPGSDPNSINPDSNGVVPVAILGSADFDVTTVDPSTVMLAGATVRVKGKSGNAGSYEDVNGDGFTDLVVQVYTTELELGDGMAELTGETYDGVSIHGTDSIRVVPPE